MEAIPYPGDSLVRKLPVPSHPPVTLLQSVASAKVPETNRIFRLTPGGLIALECTKLAGSVELIRIVESIPLVTKQGYT